MNKNVLAIIGFFIISTTISYFFHKKLQNYILACVLAAIISSVIYQVVGVVILGYLDPFFLTALMVGIAIAFVVAVLIGIPIVHSRNKNAKNQGQL